MMNYVTFLIRCLIINYLIINYNKMIQYDKVVHHITNQLLQ
jgi:hypothetical protein